MQTRLRQIAVIAFASLDVVSSFWLGSSLDQGGDSTPVYFLPFGLTFAIWGVIFLSGLIYAVYQALPGQGERALHRRIGGWVALNAALTALWNVTAGTAARAGDPQLGALLTWATVGLLAVMLFSLTRAFIVFRQMHNELTPRDRALAQFHVTVFFGWLNVAAIANTTAALDASGFTGEPNGAVWAVGLLVIAAVLASAMIRYTRPGLATIVYTGVIVWAVVGIFFNNIERSLIVTLTCVLVAAFVIVVAGVHLSRPDGGADTARAASA